MTPVEGKGLGNIRILTKSNRKIAVAPKASVFLFPKSLAAFAYARMC
jgi:hypothetical protein